MAMVYKVINSEKDSQRAELILNFIKLAFAKIQIGRVAIFKITININYE